MNSLCQITEEIGFLHILEPHIRATNAKLRGAYREYAISVDCWKCGAIEGAVPMLDFVAEEADVHFQVWLSFAEADFISITWANGTSRCDSSRSIRTIFQYARWDLSWFEWWNSTWNAEDEWNDLRTQIGQLMDGFLLCGRGGDEPRRNLNAKWFAIWRSTNEDFLPSVMKRESLRRISIIPLRFRIRCIHPATVRWFQSQS